MTDEQKEAEKNRQKKAEDAQMFKDPYMTFNVKNADGDEAEENKGILGNIGSQISSAAGSMVKNLKDQALKQVRAKRDQLINGALNKILEATGLSKVQRISAPYNVYDQNFFLD
jgi:predicted component of type VI protein secretion system